MPIPKDYSSPNRISAKDRALNQLQRWIIEGTLEPGEKLNDGELAEALGVSRTPIREALQLLVVQGFIEMNPGRDTRVTSIKKEDILKIYPPLAALQALAGEEAAIKIQWEQIDELRKLNQSFEQAIKQNDPFRAMEMDEEFHNIIIDACDNHHITSFISTLQMHIRRVKYLFLNNPTSSDSTSVKQHTEIIHALEKKDGEVVAKLMKENWISPMQRVYQLID